MTPQRRFECAGKKIWMGARIFGQNAMEFMTAAVMDVLGGFDFHPDRNICQVSKHVIIQMGFRIACQACGQETHKENALYRRLGFSTRHVKYLK